MVATEILNTYISFEYDEETGNYYCRARLYTPQTGRFLSEEPLGVDGPNLYWYVLNNPINFVDPTGEAAVGIELDFIGFLFRGGSKSKTGVASIDLNPFSETFLRVETGVISTDTAKVGFGGALTGGVNLFGALGNSTICDLEGDSLGVSAGLGPLGAGGAASSWSLTFNVGYKGLPSQAFISGDLNRARVESRTVRLKGIDLFSSFRRLFN